MIAKSLDKLVENIARLREDKAVAASGQPIPPADLLSAIAAKRRRQK